MPSNPRQLQLLAGLVAAGLLACGSLMAAPAPGPDASPLGFVWLDLDLPRESPKASQPVRNDGSTIPAAADLGISLHEGKLILRSPSGSVAVDESDDASLELTPERACLGFTVGESGSPEARHGWLLVSRDAATGLVIVHDWSCQTSPGAPLRPRPDANVSAPAGHPLSRDRQFSETQKAYSELQGAYDPYRASFPAITGPVSTVPGLGSTSGSTLSLGGSQNQLGGTLSGATLVNGAHTSTVGTFAGSNTFGITGSLTLSGAPGGANTNPGVSVISLGNPIFNTGNLNLGNLGTGLAGGVLSSGGTTLAGGAASPGSWTVVNVGGGVTGSTILTGGFTSSGSWSVANVGGDILLTWTPVPEPSTYAALLGLAVIAMAIRRRVR